MKGLNDRLRRLGAAVNKRFPNVNYGGCGVYAAAVARALEKHGVKVEVCVPEDSDPLVVVRANLANNRNPSARDWWGAGLCGAHLGVRYRNGTRWYTHDTEAIWPGRDVFGKSAGSEGPRYRAAPEGLTPDEAWGMASTAEGWNIAFSRRDVPKVRRMVAEALR